MKRKKMVRANFQQSESVMELIPQAEVKPPKQPRYTSKYRPLVLEEFKKGKCAHRTFGVPKVSISKKTEKSRPCETTLNNIDPWFKREKRKPPLPVVPVRMKATRKDDNDIPDLPKDPFKTSRVDRTKQNVLIAKQLKPPEPKKRTVHTRFGDTFDLLPSGLYPVYIRKKGYGLVPKKILITGRRKITENVAKQAEETDAESNVVKPGCRFITAEERDELLKGLKERWNEMMLRFQCLPFVIDTLPKAKKKTRMERELEELEKEIDTIERHVYICVYSDDDQ